MIIWPQIYNMKRFSLAFLLTIGIIYAQAQQTGYNSTAHWSNFSFQSPEARPDQTSDTCLVFVSNRHVMMDSLRFVDESLDTAALKYFFLQKQEGKWKVYKAATLAEVMESLPGRKDIVVYAEGMGKTFTANVERAKLMSTQYNVHVVMFDYASTNSTYKPSKNFRFARENARLSAAQYLSLLKELREARLSQASWIDGRKLSTFYHSMGNIILEKMVEEHDISSINGTPFIDNLVINAACVPSKHHRAWLEKIRFAKQVYVHYNRTDLQLKGAHLLTFKKQLGEKSKTKQRAENAIYINFHDMAGFQHSYFMNFPYNEYRLTPAMVDYFSKLFTGQDISSQEAITLLTTRSAEASRM